MFVVFMVAVVVVVVVKMLVWAAAVMNMVVVVEVFAIDVRANVVVDTLASVGMLVMPVVVIALKFVVSISYFVYVLSDVVVGALVDALAAASMMEALESAVPKL